MNIWKDYSPPADQHRCVKGTFREKAQELCRQKETLAELKETRAKTRERKLI